MAQLILPWCCLLGIALLPAAGLCAERPLRIVTFNVQCLQAPETKDSRLSRFRWSPARRAHLEAIAGVIETLEPDICALVEVTGPEIPGPSRRVARPL